VHLRRDNPNVPSDLEQMPNLLNFLESNGFVSGKHHTPLISHTATDILTALTGVYGDRMGIPVSNSYGFFKPDGSVGFQGSFLYWTALAADGKPEMVNENGKTAPAPWVAFTRAGCDVGAFSVANIEFENVSADVRTVFGVGSPEDVSVTAALSLPNIPANQPARTAPSTDYLGIAVHCAANSSLCANPHARPDLLPDEPGAPYTGFNALYGNVNVAPIICSLAPAAACDASGDVKDTSGGVIADPYGRPGFPNTFSPTAAQSLGYAATMLEAGIPVVYGYIADAHDRNPLPLDPVTNKATPAHAFGPGEADYVAQLKSYDTAFATFFARLQNDGITANNTLFVVVPDENDHFVGGAPAPADCDGVTTPCTYREIGEVSAQLDRLLATQRGNTTPFSIHNDDAPTVYIAGNPDPTAAVTRTLERDFSLLTATNPISGAVDKLSVRLADRAEMNLLHMVTSSADRTPSFTMFGDPDYFFSNAGNTTSCTLAPACILETPNFAWNHGDFQTEITRTWMGMAGPGLRRKGRTDAVSSDHTDVRLTMLSLLGFKDDYIHDGRVLAEHMSRGALPSAIARDADDFVELARVYKQLNAPLGAVGRASLAFSNASATQDDAVYAGYLARMASFTSERDELAGQIKGLLDGVEFGGRPLAGERNSGELIGRANRLIDRMRDMARVDNDSRDD
jgi:hypothetical protein